MLRFDRFSESAQEVAQRAAAIMQRFGHNQVDTEHVLVALVEQPYGDVSQLLDILKVDVNALTEALDHTLRTGPTGEIDSVGEGQIPITARVVRALELADEEAKRLEAEHISTAHIFLAILSERDTPAAKLLEGAGLTRDRVYDATQQLRR